MHRKQQVHINEGLVKKERQVERGKRQKERERERENERKK